MRVSRSSTGALSLMHLRRTVWSPVLDVGLEKVRHVGCAQEELYVLVGSVPGHSLDTGRVMRDRETSFVALHLQQSGAVGGTGHRIERYVGEGMVRTRRAVLVVTEGISLLATVAVNVRMEIVCGYW